MALANLPAWTITPDWRSGVLERLEWQTSVLASRTGVEQRRGLRLSPRRTFELSAVLTGTERSWFDLSVSRVGTGEWWLPTWHDGTRLDVAVAAGGLSLVLPTFDRSFRSPGAALLRGKAPHDYEVVEVASVDAGALNLAAGTAKAWPAGTRVYPLRRGRLTEQPKLARRSETVATTQLGFLVTEPDDHPHAVLPETYRDYPVLSVRPDERSSLEHVYERLVSDLDNGSGIPIVLDRGGRNLGTQQYSWFAFGRQEHAELRGLFYTLQGRLTPVWLPTFFADLTLAVAGDTASALVVKRSGYVNFGIGLAGRQDIRIELNDGTAYHRRITNGALTSGGNERLLLDTPLPSILQPSAVRRISFMALHRLDQDAIEIAHATDSDGVSTAVAAFRAVPETRNATLWTPTVLQGTVQTPWPCGAPTDCTAIGAWAGAYMIPTFTAYREPINTVGSLGVPCDNGHRQCWYAGYRLAVTRDGWTPELRAALAAVAPYDPYDGAFFGYRPFLSKRLRDAMLAAADAGTSTSAAMCGAKILAVGEAHSAWARQDLGADNLGRHFTVIAYSTTRRAAWFDTGFDVRDPFSGAITKHEQGTFSEYPVAGGGWLYLAEFWGDIESVFYNIYNPASPYKTHLDWYADKWSIPESPFIATIPL